MNMPYVRFRNTVADLLDCYEHMDDPVQSDEEIAARRTLIRTCKQIAIDYGDELSQKETP